MNFAADSAIAEATRKHRQRVEDWIRLHLLAHNIVGRRADIPTAGNGITIAEEAAIKSRCVLLQRDDMLTLVIDGVEVGSMSDMVVVP